MNSCAMKIAPTMKGFGNPRTKTTPPCTLKQFIERSNKNFEQFGEEESMRRVAAYVLENAYQNDQHQKAVGIVRKASVQSQTDQRQTALHLIQKAYQQSARASRMLARKIVCDARPPS